MTCKRAIWSIFETGRWIWRYASIRNYKPRERAQKPEPQKILSIDYKEHELRVLASLKHQEEAKAEILRQMAVPKDLIFPPGSSTNKATVGIDQDP